VAALSGLDIPVLQLDLADGEAVTAAILHHNSAFLSSI
jgi:hypothetical protein